MVGWNVRKWGFYDKTVKNFKPFCWWDAFRSVWMTQQNAPNGVMSWEQILEVFINQLDDEEQQFGYFQHDGATAHTTKANIAYS
jgi:hypothetical protein